MIVRAELMRIFQCSIVVALGFNGNAMAASDGSSAPPAIAHAGWTSTAPIQPPMGTGHTYYVVPDPSDPHYTADIAKLPAGTTPYTTIQAAADATAPGDTVQVMDGTYTVAPRHYVGGVLQVNTPGTAGNYITYENYPGMHPVISTAGNNDAYDDVAVLASYVVVRGFELVGNAKEVTLDYANAFAAGAAIALKAEAMASPVQYAHPGQGIKYKNAGNQSIAVNSNCVMGQSVMHVWILNNQIHDCSAAGIDFEKSDYTTIESNTVYRTSWWSVYGTSNISLHFNDNLKNTSDSSTDYRNYILDNISYDSANTQLFDLDIWHNAQGITAPTAPTDGNGIIVDTNQAPLAYVGRTLVAGNIAYKNGGSDIHSYLSSHVDIVNNTVYMAGTCPVAGSTCGPAAVDGGVSGVNYGQLYAETGVDVTIQNNILYAAKGRMLISNYNNKDVTENNNVMFTEGGRNILGGLRLSPTDITADPLFSRPAAPYENNFELSSNSPALNAGVPVSYHGVSIPALLGLKVTGGKVNIGAQP